MSHVVVSLNRRRAGKVLGARSKPPQRRPATAAAAAASGPGTTPGGAVAKLSSLVSSVVDEMTSSSATSSQSSCDDVTVAPGDDDASSDYVFRVVYMSRPDYVGRWRRLANASEHCHLIHSFIFTTKWYQKNRIVT